MIAALVDHPWPLAENLVGESGGLGVLQKFTALVKRWDLTVVPFLDRQEVDGLWQQKEYFTLRDIAPSAIGALHRIATPYIREAVSVRTATISDGPNDQGLSWRRALCDALENIEDRRTPQIVYAASQRVRWSPPRTDVNIQIDPLNGHAIPEMVSRTLVEFGAYPEHPHALVDGDPWRTFSWRSRPHQVSGPQDPCVLPKPAALVGRSPDLWQRVLAEARAQSWGKGEHYAFVPPSDWRVESGASGAWRNGAAFRCETAPGGNHHGPVDCKGRVWEWDKAKRHWDVQLRDGRHIRISCYGVWLDAPN